MKSKAQTQASKKSLFTPGLGDYRVQFFVHGIDRATCARDATLAVQRSGVLPAFEFGGSHSIRVQKEEVAEFFAWLSERYAYETRLSGPLPSMSRAREFCEIAKRSGAIKTRIESRFTVRESPGSDRFVMARAVPQSIAAACEAY